MQPAEASPSDSPHELPWLDLAALRTLLAPPVPRLVLARHRAGLLNHPRVGRGLDELEPSFHFCHKGDLHGITPSVNKALARAGVRSNKAREAVAAEAVHLARTFAGLSGDLEPRVWIGRGGPGAAEPLPPGTRLALAFSLGGEARLPHVGRLPPDTAAVLRLDPGEMPLPAAEPGRGAPLVLWLSSERAPVDGRDGVLLPGADRGPVEVVLASMPFGTLDQPSLALSLLKSAIAPVPARALYFALPFARRIGAGLYFSISEHQPFFSALLGEWLFRGALFDGPEEPDAYVREVLLKYTDRWRLSADDEPTFANLVPETLVDELLRIRAGVGEFVDACAEEVLSHRPKVVGLTSVFQQHVATLALARRLKERAPDVAVVLGGANCEGAMGLATARCFGFLDAVVSGEADVVFPLLVERLLGGLPVADLPGVYTPLSPEVPARPAHPPNAPSPRHMDDLPLPDNEDFFLQLEGSGLAGSLRPRLPFETSRGCWWGEKQHCTFCGLNGATMTFRSKSAERALDELRILTRRHPGLFVSVTDNILDMRYLKTFLPRLREEGIQAELFYEVKSNLRKEDVRQLRDAGIVEIQPGIESLSDEILRLMRKGVRGLQNVQLLKWCKELGIWPLWNLIWGFPGEPPEDYARMAALMPLLHHLPPPSGMSPICLERFSPNFDRSHEMGFEDVRPADSYRHIYPFAPADLTDLAYFFQCRHRDGRDVASYTRPVAQRIVEWREAYGECDLVAVDRGDHLLVCDTRAVAVQPLSILEGLGRALLLACDSMTTVGHLRQATGTAITRGEVEKALAPLLDRGFLIREGDSVLALTVPGTLAGEAKEKEEKP